MKATDVIRAVVNDCPMSMRKVSASMGRSQMFLGTYVSRGMLPNIELMSEIADTTGHDLLLRNRSSGNEIIIDPPIRDGLDSSHDADS